MSATHRIPATPSSVVAQIARLPQLPMAEIKALWQKLFERDVPTRNRQFLEKRIAYKLQENEFRKVNPELLEQNRQRIATLIAAEQEKKPDHVFRPLPGTVFTREYQGIDYHVIARTDGQYEFDGRIFSSLSAVAREITGTRWNGLLFFGIRAPAKAKPKTLAATKVTTRGAR